MSVQGQLLQMLEAVAAALGEDLCAQLVFVGGCTTALFVTDPVTLEDVRMTNDIDLIVDLAGYGDWLALEEQLIAKGFSTSPSDNLICRMRLGHLIVDFMPDDERILGFSNRWYALGIETSVTYSLSSSLKIKHLTAPLFVATKLEAYIGRGGNNPLGSHDLEDIFVVVDGREELLAETRDTNDAVRSFIASEMRSFQQHHEFENFLYGNIRGPDGRADIVRARIAALANCDR